MMIDDFLHDRYQLRECLSRKAGRSTYLAFDLEFQYLVVIKVLHFDPDFQWDDLKLFEREVNTLQNLDHPAIPKYLNYFEIASGFALVQTYIEAPSLETIVKAGRKFSEAEVIELADRLLSILIYLHDRLPPIIHRDLKPSNILLTNRSGNSIGDVYLVDFGSVQTFASKEGGTITVVGTYGYMPPEQFGSKTTTASDLYSLGMTLIYLTTATHPADLEHINGRIQFDRTHFSGRFARWLEKITEPPLDRRFPSARLAHTALTSTDGSYGDLLHLRPADSQVELYRNCDRLEINLPQIATRYTEENFISNSLFSLFILACFFSLGSFLGLSLGWSVISWSLKIYYLIFLALPLVLWNTRQKYLRHQTYIGYRVLSIDKVSKNFKIGVYSKSTKEFRWATNFSQNPKIDLLIYHPSYSFDNYFDEESSQNKSGLVKTSAKLSIHMGKHEYNFPEDNLSEAELHWLGQELSDFLDLELQVICHTPNIPAPPSGDPFGCGCC